MALTAAERQQRRRDKLVAARPVTQAPLAPLDGRSTRQEAWDEACETLDDLLEMYRRWRLITPAPRDALSSSALPGLDGLVQALTMVSLPEAFGQEWHLSDPDMIATAVLAAVPGRTLREQFFGAEPTATPDEPRRSPEQDERARQWWARLPQNARETWQAAARCTEPEDIYHVLQGVLKSI